MKYITPFDKYLQINENIQQAEKVYFKTNKLSDKDKGIILGITNGDNYTKIISDIYYEYKNSDYHQWQDKVDIIEKAYGELKNYNKNKFPIEEFDINNPTDILNIPRSLGIRKKIIEQIDKLPSVAIRNMKNDIRTERVYSELKDYYDKITYFMGFFSYLSNRTEKVQQKFINKMFKNNTTMEDLWGFVDDKKEFIGGVEFTKEKVYGLEQEEDLEVTYDENDIMIVRVESPEAIKKIGCNSLWCFTYGSGFDRANVDWYNYSYNGMVYVLIDFKEKTDSQDFMNVMIKPTIDDDGEFIVYEEDDYGEHPIFNMMNENITNPYRILEYLFGEEYEEVVREYLDFDLH